MINKLHTVKNKREPELLHNAIVRKRISLNRYLKCISSYKNSHSHNHTSLPEKDIHSFHWRCYMINMSCFFAWGDSFYHKHDVVGIFKRFTKEKVFVEVCIKKHNLQQYYQPLPYPVSREHVIL